jgi:sigma-E factor negative regulatory protein RseC
MRYVQGVVKSIRASVATVAVTSSAGGCGRCQEPGGCGGQSLSRAFCAPVKTIDLANTSNASVGDLVYVEMDEGALRGLATRAYVCPLAAVLLGAGAGQLLTENGSVGAVCGALLGFAVAYVALARLWSKKAQSPKLVLPSEIALKDRLVS